MTLWMGWSLLFSALLGVAAAAADRSVTSLGAPRRFIWMAAMLAACLGPIAVAARRAPPAVASMAPGNRVQTVGGSAVRRFAQPSRWRRAIAWAVKARRFDPWLARLWIIASGAVLAIFVRALVIIQRRRSRWHEARVGGRR